MLNSLEFGDRPAKGHAVLGIGDTHFQRALEGAGDGHRRHRRAEGLHVLGGHVDRRTGDRRNAIEAHHRQTVTGLVTAGVAHHRVNRDQSRHRAVGGCRHHRQMAGLIDMRDRPDQALQRAIGGQGR